MNLFCGINGTRCASGSAQYPDIVHSTCSINVTWYNHFLLSQKILPLPGSLLGLNLREVFSLFTSAQQPPAHGPSSLSVGQNSKAALASREAWLIPLHWKVISGPRWAPLQMGYPGGWGPCCVNSPLGLPKAPQATECTSGGPCHSRRPPLWPWLCPVPTAKTLGFLDQSPVHTRATTLAVLRPEAILSAAPSV